MNEETQERKGSTEKMQTRAPKLLGDFGEGLVTYALMMKGYEVARVDQVGADLIAVKGEKRLAISVKTRLFKKGSKESLVFVVEKAHIEKLEHFALQFGMVPAFALLVCIQDEHLIHLVAMPVDELRKNLPGVEHGYSIRFSTEQREELIAKPFVHHSCWEERIGDKDLF